MTNLIQTLISGLSLGSIYALIALGYTMVYGIAKMLNFAHGDVIMVGAYSGIVAVAQLGLSPWVTVIVSIVVCAVLGVVIEFCAYKPLRQAAPLSVLITAIGVSYLLQNAALLRRRVRDTHLRLERLQLPERSGTDVALCYMEGEADEGLLRALREKLMHIQLRSVAMSQETIAEAIAPRQFWNPFPKVRYTERPDVATACIMEGDVVVLVDNSASALLLPTTILRFNEEINDYYFPPLIGTYLQIIRTLVLLLTMFITPLWYLLVKNPDTLHENLRFLLVQDEYYVPLIVQLLLVELIIDILKIASLNTPDVLSNSFSMLGALILGDFAVQARWLVPEVLVYMAFVAVANYAQHSYEMGYATKLCRMLLLVLIWLWDWWGFAAGIVITLTLIATAKPLVGKGYLYPLIPFDRKKLARLLYRRPVTKKNS